MNYIKSPAIKFKLTRFSEFKIVENYCHQACYDQIQHTYEIYPRTYADKYSVVEGFTLMDGTFVDREKAITIAKNADQLKDTYSSASSLESHMLKFFGGHYEN